MTPLDAYVKYIKGDFSTSRSNLKYANEEQWTVEDGVKIIRKHNKQYIKHQKERQDTDIRFDLKPVTYVKIKEENNYLSNHYMNRVNDFDAKNNIVDISKLQK